MKLKAKVCFSEGFASTKEWVEVTDRTNQVVLRIPLRKDQIKIGHWIVKAINKRRSKS